MKPIDPKQIGYFLILFGILFLVVITPSFLPVQNQQQKQTNVAANEQSKSNVTIASIFENNFFVASLTLIPILGWGLILAVMWNTGLVVASYSQPGTLWILFAVIEISVYSFMLLQSINCVNLFLKRKTVKPWRVIGKTILAALCIAGLILWFSAAWEYLLIK